MPSTREQHKQQDFGWILLSKESYGMFNNIDLNY